MSNCINSVTISLERLKELEKYEAAYKSGNAIRIRTRYDNYDGQVIASLNKEDVSSEIVELNKKLSLKVKELENKERRLTYIEKSFAFRRFKWLISGLKYRY